MDTNNRGPGIRSVLDLATSALEQLHSLLLVWKMASQDVYHLHEIVASLRRLLAGSASETKCVSTTESTIQLLYSFSSC